MYNKNAVEIVQWKKDHFIIKLLQISLIVLKAVKTRREVTFIGSPSESLTFFLSTSKWWNVECKKAYLSAIKVFQLTWKWFYFNQLLKVFYSFFFFGVLCQNYFSVFFKLLNLQEEKKTRSRWWLKRLRAEPPLISKNPVLIALRPVKVEV